MNSVGEGAEPDLAGEWVDAHRAVSLRVRASPRKFRQLFLLASACRWVWNWATRTNRAEYGAWRALEDNPWAWRNPLPKPSVTFFTWSARFTKVRQATDWLGALPYDPLRATLSHWAKTWENFFDPEHPQDAPPKFHGRAHHSLRVSFPGGRVALSGSSLRLPGIGWVRLSGSNQHADGKLTRAHLFTEDGDKWRAVLFYAAKVWRRADDGLSIGVDMNCGQVAVSTGELLHAPDTRVLEAKRKRHQRRADRRKPGSNRRRGAHGKSVKAARRKSNVVGNWRHHVSRVLANSAGRVAVERLPVRGMTKSAKGDAENPGKGVAAKSGLNKAILGTGWGDLRKKIGYKALELVLVDPRDTSRRCHQCGFVDSRNRRTQADFACLSCGAEGNADVNAARNVEARGTGASGRRAAWSLDPAMTRQPHLWRIDRPPGPERQPVN